MEKQEKAVKLFKVQYSVNSELVFKRIQSVTFEKSAGKKTNRKERKFDFEKNNAYN